MDELEIYFRDLTPEARVRFLAFTGCESAADGNWDVMPIACIPKPEIENDKSSVKV